MQGFNLDLPALALQEAIQLRLEGDGITVYDEPPEGSKIDYVVIGDQDIVPSEEFQTKTVQAYTCTVNLDCYSQQRGMKAVHTIAAAAAASLSSPPLAVTGWNVDRWEHETYSSRRDQANTGIPIRSGELRLTFSLVK